MNNSRIAWICSFVRSFVCFIDMCFAIKKCRFVYKSAYRNACIVRERVYVLLGCSCMGEMLFDDDTKYAFHHLILFALLFLWFVLRFSKHLHFHFTKTNTDEFNTSTKSISYSLCIVNCFGKNEMIFPPTWIEF